MCDVSQHVCMHDWHYVGLYLISDMNYFLKLCRGALKPISMHSWCLQNSSAIQEKLYDTITCVHGDEVQHHPIQPSTTPHIFSLKVVVWPTYFSSCHDNSSCVSYYPVKLPCVSVRDTCHCMQNATSNISA